MASEPEKGSPSETTGKAEAMPAQVQDVDSDPDFDDLDGMNSATTALQRR